jgi:serine/threonine protein kinase
VLANPLSKRLDESELHKAEELRRLGFAPYDEKVDVWAVGVLAYELMSGGDPPFFDDRPEVTQRLIMQVGGLSTVGMLGGWEGGKRVAGDEGAGQH